MIVGKLFLFLISNFFFFFSIISPIFLISNSPNFIDNFSQSWDKNTKEEEIIWRKIER